MRFFWKQYFNFMGWKVPNPFPTEVKKGLVIVAPHSSNWDFINGLVIRSTLRLTHIKYLGKAELFKAPWGFIFKALGGFPLHRGAGGQVENVIETFKNNDNLLIAMAPEGTRKRVDKLRTGFYYIAKEANLPIILCGFDYSKKEVLFKKSNYPTENSEADLKEITQWFSQFGGKNSQQDLTHLKEVD